MLKMGARPRTITSRVSKSFTFTLLAEVRPRIGDVEPLSDPSNPFHLRAKRRWEATDKSMLSCDFVAAKAIFSKAVVRNYCRKRLRRTYFKVLEENGLDETGKSRPGATQWGERSGRQIVKGNSMIKANLATLMTPGLELLKEMRAAVDHLLKVMGIQKDERAPPGSRQNNQSTKNAERPEMRMDRGQTQAARRSDGCPMDGSIKESKGPPGDGREQSSDRRHSRSGLGGSIAPSGQ